MTGPTELPEPSFLDLVAAIKQATELSDERRGHWVCSARQIAKWLDRPITLVPARWTPIHIAVGQLHHARLGVRPKTLANHRANVKAALRWFRKELDLPQRAARLMVDWATLRDKIESRMMSRISNLVRHCSARGIPPSAVDDTVFNAYWCYRSEMTALASNSTQRRFMVRAWNACAATIPDLSLQRLTEPPLKVLAEPEWNQFPEELRKDVDDYFDGLARAHRTPNGKRIAPCCERTIQYRRAELIAFARMAVRLGTPVESLTSLGALLQPDVVEGVLDAYWQKNGETPNTGTIDLGKKLLRMARETGCLDSTAIERLDDLRSALETHRREGLTPKNLQLIRQVLTAGVWNEVVSLPNALMEQARSLKDYAPIKAGVTAQLATAVSILTFAPVRLSNLVSIELDKTSPNPAGSIHRIGSFRSMM
jgi:hypothetical protein